MTKSERVGAALAGRPVDRVPVSFWRHFPEIDTYLCAYNWRRCSMEAAARVLAGEIEPRGELPVILPGTPRD